MKLSLKRSYQAKSRPLGSTQHRTYCSSVLSYIPFSLGSTTNHGGYRYTDKAFIYSLRNEEGIRPIKGMVKDPSQAIFVNPSYGPTFGGGHDIYIADNANGNGNSYTRIGISYDAPTGVEEQVTTVRFTPDEVEVFYLL